jgi:hypothetical protein
MATLVKAKHPDGRVLYLTVDTSFHPDPVHAHRFHNRILAELSVVHQEQRTALGREGFTFETVDSKTVTRTGVGVGASE